MNMYDDEKPTKKKEYGVTVEQDVSISLDTLRDDLEVNPSLLWNHGKDLAEAKKVKDRAYKALKIAKADEELMIRAAPPDGMKMTESVIEALVQTRPKILELEEELLKATESVYLLEALVNAVEDRGSRMRDLIESTKIGLISVS